MTAEENKALVRRFVEAQVKADLDTLDELLASDFVDHSLEPGQDAGRDGYMRGVVEESFSNQRTIIEDQAADGDKVISRLTINRIHDRGEFMGVAPTGMELQSTAIVIHRISGGKIVEEWSESSGLFEATRQRLEKERLERALVEEELRVARRIQQASLPKEVPELEGWQIAPYYQPAREVGGDFYDFFELENGHLGLVVGDATGKGVPAALVMSTTCGMLGAVSLSLDSPGHSDGLVEAHDPRREMFGFPRLRALIGEQGEEHSLVDSLLAELRSFTGEEWEQEDDITLLTLRRRSAACC